MLMVCFLLIVSLPLIVILKSFDSLLDLFSDMEFRVEGIAKEAERLYRENYCAKTCDTLSYHSCSAYKPELQCSTVYPEVETCNETRRMVGLKTTNVLNPSSKTISNKTKYSDLDDPLIRRDVCAYIDLFDVFLDNASQDFIKWIYFGSSNGVYRGLPYIDMCIIYDVRLRPWFIAGSTGAKNLIIVIDLSESMSSNMINSKKTRLEVVIDAYTVMIESLTESDWVGLVTFNGKAIAHAETLQLATTSFKENLIKKFKQFKAAGKSNFEDAFKKVFQMFKKSAKENMMNKGCINIISFISDGPTSSGLGSDGNPEPLLELIRTLNEEVGAIIFTLTIGEDNVDPIPKKIACLGNGIWSQVREEDNVRDIFLGYYQVLASTLTIDHAIWSEIYQDASGLGPVISVVYPAYDRTQSPPVFLGVASMDLTVSEFDKYADKDNSYTLMRARNKKCSSKTIDKCQMEALRGPNQKCNENCTQSTTKLCTDDIIGPIFYKPDEIHKDIPYKEEPCCYTKSTKSSNNETVIIQKEKDDAQSTKTFPIGGIIGVIIAILIFVIVPYLIRRKCKQSKEQLAQIQKKQNNDGIPLTQIPFSPQNQQGQGDDLQQGLIPERNMQNQGDQILESLQQRVQAYQEPPQQDQSQRDEPQQEHPQQEQRLESQPLQEQPLEEQKSQGQKKEAH